MSVVSPTHVSRSFRLPIQCKHSSCSFLRLYTTQKEELPAGIICNSESVGHGSATYDSDASYSYNVKMKKRRIQEHCTRVDCCGYSPLDESTARRTSTLVDSLSAAHSSPANT